jgi:putative cofactor-binding repeat protein
MTSHPPRAEDAVNGRNATSDTRVVGNTIYSGRTGILSEGFDRAFAVSFPSTCSGDPSRLCASNADCGIAPAAGTCGATTPGVIDGRAVGTFDDHNLLVGPFGNGLLTQSTGADAAVSSYGSTIHGVITNNVILANGSPGFRQAGIWLAQWGLLDTVVSGNTVEGASVGLLLADGTIGTAALGITWGARIHGNDFVSWSEYGAYTSAQYSPHGYHLPSELSDGGAGNYWGHSSAPGFSSLDTNDLLVTDSYPFCSPVAGAVSLPPTCP